MTCRRLLSTVIASVVVGVAPLVVTGCDMSELSKSPYDSSPSEVAAAEATLAQWPTLEETTTEVQETMVGIRTVIDTEIPGIRWNTDSSAASAGCDGRYLHTSGEVAYLSHLVGENVAVSEENWSHIASGIRPILVAFGAATGAQVFHDAPGHHDVTFTNDANGNSISLSYAGNVVITGHTGCRLPAARRTHPHVPGETPS